MDSDKKIKFIAIMVVVIPIIIVGLLWINGQTFRYELVTQHGEFPFRYEYEKDGQRYVIDDTLVVDYKGMGFELFQYLKSEGPDAVWKDYRSGPSLLLYESDGWVHSYDSNLDKVTQNVWLSLNSGSFMGAIDYDKRLSIQLVEMEEYESIQEATHIPLSEQQLYEDFGIKTISWTPPEPIDNEYVKKCLLCF
jgi:hypothetical protein